MSNEEDVVIYYPTAENHHLNGGHLYVHPNDSDQLDSERFIHIELTRDWNKAVAYVPIKNLLQAISNVTGGIIAWGRDESHVETVVRSEYRTDVLTPEG